MSSDDDDSPCVRNCCLDAADVCVGCGRSLDEILRWSQADRAWRQGVLHVARERLARRAESMRRKP